MARIDEVVEWLRKYSCSFINARKLSRKLNVNSKVAAHLLRQLNVRGYIVLYRRRKGRFNIYRVNRGKLKGEVATTVRGVKLVAADRLVDNEFRARGRSTPT